MTNAQNNSGADSKRFSFFICLGLFLVTLFCVRTISNAEFWMHLALGRGLAEQGFSRVDTLTFTAAGQPYLNPSWLFDRFLFPLWQLGGATFIILAHAVAVQGEIVIVAVAEAHLFVGLQAA